MRTDAHKWAPESAWLALWQPRAWREGWTDYYMVSALTPGRLWHTTCYMFGNWCFRQHGRVCISERYHGIEIHHASTTRQCSIISLEPEDLARLLAVQEAAYKAEGATRDAYWSRLVEAVISMEHSQHATALDHMLAHLS